METVSEQVNLLSNLFPDVIEEKVVRAFDDSTKTMTQVMGFTTNLKRKDFCGKLKELLTAKFFTYPFTLKKKLSPCLFQLEPLGEKNKTFTCVFPTQLETALVNKDFFTEGDIYLFAQLSICVSKENGNPMVFFLVTHRTKSMLC